MAKTVLVTDEAAQAQASDLRERNYMDVNGNAVSGEEVVRSIETGTYDTSKLEPVAGGADPGVTPGPEPAASVGGAASNMVNQLGAVFLEYQILGRLLGSKKGMLQKGLTLGLIGLGQYMNVLPTSISPLLGAASGLVGTVLGPDASAMVEKLQGVIPEPASGDTSLLTGLLDGTLDLTGSGLPEEVRAVVTEGSDFLERDEGDKTIATAENRVRAIYANVFGEEAPDLRTADPKEIQKYMSANGKLMATDGVFASCAAKAETDREFAGMRAVTAASCAMLEEAAGDSRKKAAKGFLTMAKGLAAYETGAREGFEEKYPDGAEKAEAGLAKVMDASRGPLVESVRKMQMEYGLFSEDQLEQLRELVPELAADPTFGHEDEYVPDESLLSGTEPSTDGYKGFKACSGAQQEPSTGKRAQPPQPSGKEPDGVDGPDVG